MKAIQQHKKIFSTKELQDLYSKLTQAKGLLFFINKHVQDNKTLCFEYDINHGLLWGIEALITDCYDLLIKNGDTGQSLSKYYIKLYEPLIQAKATILFIITHVEENKKFLCDIEILESVLLNITFLINKALNKILEGE